VDKNLAKALDAELSLSESNKAVGGAVTDIINRWDPFGRYILKHKTGLGRPDFSDCLVPVATQARCSPVAAVCQ
jgi:hypothetical protein